MDDINQTLKDPNEEYQYQPPEETSAASGDVGTGEYQSEALDDTTAYTTSAAGKFDKSKLKKILLPIGLVVVILLVYQVLSWYSKGKEQAMQQQPKTVATKPITPGSLAVTSVPTIVPHIATTTAQDEQKIDALHDQVVQNSQQLTYLANTINQSQVRIATLDSTLTNLSASVNALNKNLNDYLASVKQAQQPKKKLVLPKKIFYHVKAIVPGRAWIESAEGKTISVRIGDKVNDGTVQIISPDKGMVVTSTGEIIQYGSNDI